jgi:hypothetical protein
MLARAKTYDPLRRVISVFLKQNGVESTCIPCDTA